jgi:FAD-dependent urate hydroxylase
MTKALVIGGGIAGPVTAMALQKAGIDAAVYEAYDRTADGVGAFLSLAVNGLRVLETLDLGDMVGSLGFDTPRMVLFNGKGRRLGEVRAGGRLADGTVTRTVRRSDLYVALRDETVRRGVPVEYGKRLVDAVTTGDGVAARFADGTEATGDLLVGADGLQSRTRTIVDPAAPAPRYLGLLNTGGYARRVTVDSEPGVMNMIFGKRCFFCHFLSPEGDVWWFANPVRADEPSREALYEITAEEWRESLVDLFREDVTPAADIIRATPHILPPWGTYDLPSVPTWHRGRMIIVGDAAHAASPASGQGASMALEDAVMLARCLRDVPDITEAFETHERLRRERVERVVAQGKRNGDGKAPGPIGRVGRDLVLRLMFAIQERQHRQPLAWMYDYHIYWDTPARAA